MSNTCSNRADVADSEGRIRAVCSQLQGILASGQNLPDDLVGETTNWVAVISDPKLADFSDAFPGRAGEFAERAEALVARIKEAALPCPACDVPDASGGAMGHPMNPELLSVGPARPPADAACDHREEPARPGVEENELPAESSKASPPAFPWEALETWEQDLYAEIGETIGVDPVGVAVQALPAKAAAAQKTCVVTGHGGDFDLWTSIFFIESAPTAKGKSAVRNSLDRPLHDLEAAMGESSRAGRIEASAREALARLDAHNLTKEIHDATAEVREERMGELVQAFAGVEALRERTSTITRYVTSDASWAAIKTLMASTGRIYLATDEGRSLLRLVTDTDSLCKAYSHSPLHHDRSKKIRMPITDPAITMALAVQPTVLADVVNNAVYAGVGLLGRMLFHASEVRTPGRPRTTRALVAKYHERIQQLAQNPVFTRRDTCTAKFVIEGEALDLYLDLRHSALLRAEEGDLACLHGWGSRMAENMLRIAGILHAWKYPQLDQGVLPLRTVETAVAIAEYFADHAKRASEEALSSPGTRAQQILNWIAGKPDVLSSRILNVRTMMKNRFNDLDKEDIEPALQRLVDDGWLRALPIVNNSKKYEVLQAPTRHRG